jgi:membrane-associated protease RseP (regulator of RpoE activity)
VYILLFVVVIGGAIIIHEAGHYLTARWFGMKAERFFVGFGPTLWSTQRGETEVGLKAIPAGGFVKIAGMNRHDPVDPADEPRAFYNKPAWQRAIVLGAGSFTHFVLAMVLLFIAMAFFAVPRLSGGEPVINTTVGSVQAGTAAEVAGLEAGDLLLSVDGRDATQPGDAVALIQERAGETFPVTVERGGETREVTVSLPATNPAGEAVGFMGIGIEAVPYDQRGIGESLVATVRGEYSIWNQTAMTVRGIRQVFTPEALGSWLQQADSDQPRGAEGPISLVGAGQIVGALGNLGQIGAVILLMANINIVIGLLNMLPLPPFDGGHLAQLGIERSVNAVRGVRGKSTDWELSPSVVTPVALAVLLLLIGFAATAFYIDIVNPASRLFE